MARPGHAASMSASLETSAPALLNKYVKQRYGTFTQRHGFGVPKKDLAFQIEAKRTESINGRDCPVLLLRVT